MANRVRVLFATPEAHPLAKTGGLGDVGGALPQALESVGVDVHILLPAYPGLIENAGAQPVGVPFPVLPDAAPVRLWAGALPGNNTPVYLVDCPSLYHRSSGPYLDADGRDWPDNWLRFAVFSRVAALIGQGKGPTGWVPQIVHCNDWQTGLAPAYLTQAEGSRAKTVMTVHNMAFQGNFPAQLTDAVGLGPAAYDVEGAEFYGQISFLKAGLYYADHITTVSPTYAREIQTPEFGGGMQGLLTARKDRLTGILNGIDTELWDPNADRHLTVHYSRDNMAGKTANKLALQKRLGLAPRRELPLLGMVSRLTYQKGVDLVLEVAEALVAQPLQLAVLGTGDKSCEMRLRQLAADYPDRIGIVTAYDEALAHLIEAGSDIFLMPSRFEPCGLNQMYSMRYGTPPVVRLTGGLADSVVDTTPASLQSGTATGFVFDRARESELLASVLRALIVFRDRKAWRKLQANGMAHDFSWQASARRYQELYLSMLGSRTEAQSTREAPTELTPATGKAAS